MQLNRTIFFKLLCAIFCVASIACKAQNKKEHLRYKVIKDFLEQYDSKVALFYKSNENIPFDLPLKKETLSYYDLTNRYNIDSLVTSEDISSWNEAIKDLHVVKWDPEKFPNRKIVKKKPVYMQESPRNPKGEPYPIDYIVYLSTPFLNKTKDKAILWQMKYFSPMNVSTRYFILFLEDNHWIVKAKGTISYS